MPRAVPARVLEDLLVGQVADDAGGIHAEQLADLPRDREEDRRRRLSLGDLRGHPAQRCLLARQHGAPDLACQGPVTGAGGKLPDQHADGE